MKKWALSLLFLLAWPSFVVPRATALEFRPEDAIKEPSYQKRRPGLPERTKSESIIKGQFTDKEWEMVRSYAMKVQKDIVWFGSLSETDLGLFRRYAALDDPSLIEKYHIPKFRSKKLESSLVDEGFADLDIWQGSNLSRRELGEIRRQIFPEFSHEKIKEAYSLERYPDLESFSKVGAIIFHKDGRVSRILAPWQKENP